MYYIKYDYLKDRHWLMCQITDNVVTGYDIQHIHSFEWDKNEKSIYLNFGAGWKVIITEQDNSNIYAYIIKLLNLE